MTTSLHPWEDIALPLLQHFEGFAPTPYRCPVGRWTVGWGHLLTPTEHQAMVFPLSQDQGLDLLLQDMHRHNQGLQRQLQVSLAPHEQAALVSFVFNVGLAAFQRSTLRQCLHRREYHRVPTQLQRWIWAGGRRLPGLIRRRQVEGEVFGGKCLVC